MPIQTSQDGSDTALPLLGSSYLSDEGVLKNAFLAEHPTLAAEARKTLGADAAALVPKVVEGAFVRAWDARASLATSAQLHDFLIEDVQHAAARALSRRAGAHRFAVHEGGSAAPHAVAETTADQSWGHIQHALHGEAHSPQALAEAAQHSRHEAATHIATVTKERSTWAAIAIGALVIIAMVGGVFVLDRMGADEKVATAVNATDARVVQSLPGQLGVVTLDDGSVVRLAPESKLFIPSSFGPNIRAVRLDGTANFEVAAGQPIELQVHAGNVVLVAKGTRFMVHSYAADSTTTVVVSEGTVEVRQNKAVVQTLTAGQALVSRVGAAPRAATAAEKEEADAWRSGEMIVANRPLHDVLPLLRRWYGLTLAVQPDSLSARPVTLRVSLDSSRAALRAVEKSTGLAFGYMGQNMVFRLPAAASAKR